MRSHLPGKSLYVTFWRLPLILAICTVLVDQFTKWLTVTKISQGHAISVIPGFFNVVHYRNPGAAWGILAGQTGLLALISIAVLILLAFGFDKVTERFPERCLALGFVAGGIFGNLIDRILWGEVIDFIDVFVVRYHWPAFNIADSGITCGVIVFILSTFFQHELKEPKPGADEASQTTP